MKLRPVRLVSAITLALCLDTAAAANPVQGDRSSNVGPIINDYSNQGAVDYSGTQPQHGMRKEFRSTSEDEPATAGTDAPVNDYSGQGAESGTAKTDDETSGPDASESASAEPMPVINDYSNLGAEYGSTAAPDAQTSADTSGPIINDYSSQGAEYGSSDSKNADPSSHAAMQSAAPQNVTLVDLTDGHESFNGNCAQCHGQDGVGSTFAPSLVDRLKGMEYAEFVEVVTHGKTTFDSATGGYSVMPAWDNNPGVMARMDQLWVYLKARSDGELGTGRPQ